MDNNKRNETSEGEQRERDLLEELKGYGHESTLWVVNRGGDLYFIECPACHSIEVDKEVLFGCRCCKGYFDVNPEDGFRAIRVLTDLGPVRSYDKKIKLIGLKQDPYAHQQVYGRNERKLKELLERCPEAKILIINRDLHAGRDAHGHSRYNRYALIPLDPQDADITEIKQVLKYLMKEDLKKKDFTGQGEKEKGGDEGSRG